MASGEYPRGVKIGVDVGMVRVGVAASDRDGLIATPVCTLNRDSRKNRDLRLLLRNIVELAAVEVFVGLPRNLSGTESASTAMARSYAATLSGMISEAHMDVPVRLIDERLSSVSAHRSLRQAGLNSRQHRKVVDQVAAVEILQHAIDMQRNLERDVGEPVVQDRRRSLDPPSASSEESDISQTYSGRKEEQ
ncbi:Holliday junction resolvase [Arthrobacter sp. Soil782]|uniref:Holliday junction resolvase RuvX n=1 Tax=Arthrobacter sp. Soil782 TaxID=1736410 RepID=UPI0006FBCF36|nr:Holliday junction resolvase RuvX [Arthrobacter sp. Soil782]KRF04590.1 Holliday junction resolvase [Arthrobacter sp. Soil782]